MKTNSERDLHSRPQCFVQRWMPNGHVKGFDTQNDESAKRQLTDNIPLRDVIRTFMAARYKTLGPGLQIPTRNYNAGRDLQRFIS